MSHVKTVRVIKEEEEVRKQIVQGEISSFFSPFFPSCCCLAPAGNNTRPQSCSESTADGHVYYTTTRGRALSWPCSVRVCVCGTRLVDRYTYTGHAKKAEKAAFLVL